MGGTDVDDSRIINKQPASGVLFSSANDKSWTAIQNEDLKFNLYRANFTSSTGIAYIENKEIDYLNIDNLTGTFNAEEKVTGESILVVANTQTLSVGTVIRNKTNVANGTIRSIGTYGGGQVAIKIDNKGTFAQQLVMQKIFMSEQAHL